MNTQIAAVRKHLESGRTLSKMEATEPPFSSTNLGDIILRLRREMNIGKEMRINLNSGRRYAEYFLIK